MLQTQRYLEFVVVAVQFLTDDLFLKRSGCEKGGS